MHNPYLKGYCMTRSFLPMVVVLVLTLCAVGCSGSGSCFMGCAFKCANSPTHACQEACEAENGCRPKEESEAEEEVGTAQGALTPTLSARWTITNQSAPGTATACLDPNSTTWCRCGTNYTDSAVATRSLATVARPRARSNRAGPVQPRGSHARPRAATASRRAPRPATTATS